MLQRTYPDGSRLLAVPRNLAAIAAEQDGVLTRRQLAASGVSPGQLKAAVAARRWRTFGRNVVVLANAALSQRQRLWVAVLLPGTPCALAGLSAAEAAGLRGFESEKVHILVPHSTHAGAPSWVKIHESRRFTDQDINRAFGLPRTRSARSVIDAAAWSRFPRRACALLCAAVQQRVTTAERLSAELALAGAVRHVRLMRAILGDIAGGGHTLAEIDLGRLAARAGLPSPERQRIRREPDGAVRYLDAEFDLPDGTVLTVEVDGRGHMHVETWLDDTDRQNEVVIGGRPVLRFPSLTVRLEEARVGRSARGNARRDDPR